VNKLSDNSPKLGLALGSGGARGLAHIGVLEVLENENIKIDYITGSSMGSLIGALYASGVPLKYIIVLAEELEWENLSDITFPKNGLLKGNKILKFVELMTKNKNFSELNIPFAAVACDIENGEHLIIKEGSVADAVRASTAVPGIFIPFNLNGRKLVDGGLVDPVPVSSCYNLGADVVVGVNVNLKKIDNQVNNIFDVLLNTFDIMQLKLNSKRNYQVDLMIKPELNELSAYDLDKAEFFIEAGRKAAKNSLDKIKYLLKEDNYEKK
jgi:NTE family protein